MRVDRFGRGVAFAAIAGLGLIGWQLAVLPVLWGGALPLGLALLVVLWLFAVAPTAAKGLRLTLAAGPLALLIAALSPSLIMTVALLTVLIGVARGTFISGQPPARAVVSEVLIGGAALVVGGLLHSGSLLSLGLATWGYFLIQSLALLPRAPATRPSRGADPFEAAHARATELLDAL